jgi:hypothetical protein
MKVIGLIAAGLLLFSQVATAASWAAISFKTTPQSAPKVLAATDKLLGSAVGKEFPGKLLLQVHVADGNDPATHSFIPIYKTAAEREAFMAKLQADPAWGAFMAVITKETQPVSTVWLKTIKSWGEIVDTDHVWEAHSFNVSDPAAFLAAMDKFIGSETGKKFPGQVYLSAVVAGGLSPVSHVVSVGFASEAEMDAWSDLRNGTPDWLTFREESRKVSDYLGTTLARDLKTWGPATLKDVTAR